MRPCSQKLQCDKCDFEWQDPSQVISYNPLSWINPNREKQYFSYLAELFQGKPCPICKTIIFKAAGCDHMTCSKCGGDFCWLCLNIMDGPRHPQDTMCPSHRGWTTLFIICSIFSLYFHLSYRFKSVNYYGGYALYWIAVVASLIICGLIVLICFDLISRWYRFGSNKCQAYFSIAVLPTMIAGFVLLVIYTRFGYHMGLTLGIGVISACVLACVAGIVAFLVDRLTRRNYQRFVDEVELDEANRGNQDLENQNNQHVVNRDEEEVVREDVGNRQNRPPSRNRSSERRKNRSSRRVGTERNSFERKRKSRRKSTKREKKSKSRKSKSKKARARGKRLRE